MSIDLERAKLPGETPILRRARLAVLLHAAARQSLGISAAPLRPFSGEERLRLSGDTLFAAGLSEMDACHVRAEAALRSLADACAASPEALDLLALAVALDRNPLLFDALRSLGPAAQGGATPYVAMCLFDHPELLHLGPSHPLLRWRLLRLPLSDSPSSDVACSPDPFAVRFLVSGDPMEAGLRAELATTSNEEAPLFPAITEELLGLIRSARASALGPASVEVELVSPPGGGKKTLARRIASAFGAPLLAVDAAASLGQDRQSADAQEAAIRAVRTAKLVGAALFLDRADSLHPQVWSAISGEVPLVFVGVSSQEPAPERPASARVLRVSSSLPELRREDRVSLWRRLSSSDPPPEILRSPLSPADIASAARATHLGLPAIAEVRRSRRPPSAGQLTRLPCPFSPEDLVLGALLKQHLDDLISQVEHRTDVYEGWGLERLCPLGRGITALFAGPSGTGKTMAAQVVARRLGLELYRVDLATVVSKYIGETEKNLKRVFDACERADVVLFFDEADALFGQRTQVKDAHDRFANIEIDYLLQRMEQFSGLAILATNRKGDLDSAFVRRIRFIIDFVRPGAEERKAIWRKALLPPPGAPRPDLDPIDFDLLAARLDMTGADIKATALGAAFLARAEDRPIGMSHVLRAAGRELTKRGVVLRTGDLARGLQ